MEDFNNLKKSILECRECEKLFGFEPQPIVFGSKFAKIVQISQAPSKDVNESKKPFTDASGKKLKYEWYQIEDNDFYKEKNFYITSLGHCFPGKANNGGDKAPPKRCADKWLKKEVEIIDSQLIIIIGKKAADYFFKGEDYNSLIFKDNYINGRKTIVLPHPSPLNVKWFKDHPDFESRIIEVRKEIKNILEEEKENGND